MAIKKKAKPAKAVKPSKPVKQPTAKGKIPVPAKKNAPVKKVAPKPAPKPAAKAVVVKKAAPAPVAKKVVPVKVDLKKAVKKPLPAAPVKPEKKSAPLKPQKVEKKSKKVVEEEEEVFGEVVERKKVEEEDDDELFSEKGSKTKTERLKKDLVVDATAKLFDLKDFFSWKELEPKILNQELFLPKDDACLERGCDNIRTTDLYCRLHYIALWKTIQRKKEILKEGKLQEIIEEIVTKYPPQFIAALLDDMSDDREFNRVLSELNISDAELESEEAEVAATEEDEDSDLEFEARSMDSFKPGFDED